MQVNYPPSRGARPFRWALGALGAVAFIAGLGILCLAVDGSIGTAFASSGLSTAILGVCMMAASEGLRLLGCVADDIRRQRELFEEARKGSKSGTAAEEA